MRKGARGEAKEVVGADGRRVAVVDCERCRGSGQCGCGNTSCKRTCEACHGVGVQPVRSLPADGAAVAAAAPSAHSGKGKAEADAYESQLAAENGKRQRRRSLAFLLKAEAARLLALSTHAAMLDATAGEHLAQLAGGLDAVACEVADG